FDDQPPPPRRGPRKADSNARPLCPLRNLGIHAHLNAAKELMHNLRSNHDLLRMPLSNLARDLAAHGSNLLFKLTNTRLPRVMPRNQMHAVLRKFDLLSIDAVLFDLPR